MILENYSGSAAAEEFVSGDHEQYMETVVGDPAELQEMTNECVSDIHNLTVALARFEHKCIVESAGEELLNEGIGEFFAKVKAKIVEYWNRFKAWVVQLVNKIRGSVFAPRKKWLDEKRTELNTASFKKDAKVSIYSLMKPGKAEEAAEKLGMKAYQEAVKAAEKYSKSKQSTEDLKSALESAMMAGKKKGESAMAYLERTYLGKEEEAKLESGLVKQLIKIADDTFKLADTLPGVQKIADGMIQVADAQLKPGASDSTEAKNIKHRLAEALNVVGPMISQGVSAMIALNSKYNAKAMSALASAYSNRAGTKLGEEGSLLSAYM